MERTLTNRLTPILAILGVIVVNGLANALPLGGQTTGAVSAQYPSLFTPAGFTFGIWSLIYLGLLAFVIYQALPGQKRDASLARIMPWFLVNCGANALWIVLWHYDFIAGSLLVMGLLLATLVGIYRQLNIVQAGQGFAQRWCVQGPFSLYTAWICVATLANISALQTAIDANSLWLDPVSWTHLKLAVAGLVGAVVVVRRCDAVFGGVVAWASWGIAVKQVATPSVAGGATTLSAMMVGLIIWVLVFRPTRQG